MSFQSFDFLAFVAVTRAVCLALGRREQRLGQLPLLLACLFFYVAGAGWQSLLVLAAGMAVTMAALEHLRGGEGPARRRALVLGCCWHTAVLLVFKYTGFFTGGSVSIGWVPLGLSFFTFQQLWLLKEAYTRQYEPIQDDDLALYTFFFPTVTSGPILRPGAFFPQLRESAFLQPQWEDIAAGLYAICFGMGKKVLLADSFGVIVDNGWAQLGDLSAPAAWLVILGYTLQLYFDFSGYSDIATGVARLFGIRLPLNFDSPYRALSVGEFWKRWHITLTTFLRECVYFPLGGSRRGEARTYLNIMAIFLISGFWHGAGWTFILWGALHGLGQVAERLWGSGRDRLPAAVRWAVTFAFVNLAWVFFRAPDLSGAWQLLSAAATGGLARPESWLLSGLFSKETGALQILLPALKPWINTLRVVGLYGIGLLAALWPRNTVGQMDTFRPTFWRGLALAVMTAWSILSFTGITTFIYSNF